MQVNKKQNIVIGIIISVLLSLFVNYSLFAINFEIALTEKGVIEINDKTLLFFSFVWFIVISFILYLVTIRILSLGKKLLQKEYKAVLLAVLVDLLLIFILIRIYSVIEDRFTVTHSFVVVEGDSDGPIIEGIVTDTIVTSYSFSGEIAEGSFVVPDQLEMPAVTTISEMIYKRPVITEHVFILVTVFMFVMLMRILDSRREMVLKIEKLQRENLQSSYDALMGQINPHFFFNFLGGLNSLIRSGEQERTLTYLEELTSVFRYILQSNRKEIVSLSEELDFVKAYIYLLSIRFEGKLFFSLDIDSQYLNYRLPVLSFLPLIENAIKHNVVSKSHPLHVSIYIDPDEQLVVSNPLQPKTVSEDCNGIGLKNLLGRYELLMGKDIAVIHQKEHFIVRLPLLKPLGE